MSKQMQNIYEYLQQDGRFKSIVSALRKTKLDKLLASPGDFTVFAPTDAECELDLQKKGTSCKEVLSDEKLLVKLIRCHIIEGNFPTRKLATIVVLNPMNGRSLMVEYDKGIKLNGDTRITEKNIACSNGILHIVDGMLCPKGQLRKK